MIRFEIMHIPLFRQCYIYIESNVEYKYDEYFIFGIRIAKIQVLR